MKLDADADRDAADDHPQISPLLTVVEDPEQRIQEKHRPEGRRVRIPCEPGIFERIKGQRIERGEGSRYPDIEIPPEERIEKRDGKDGAEKVRIGHPVRIVPKDLRRCSLEPIERRTELEFGAARLRSEERKRIDALHRAADECRVPRLVGIHAEPVVIVIRADEDTGDEYRPQYERVCRDLFDRENIFHNGYSYWEIPSLSFPRRRESLPTGRQAPLAEYHTKQNLSGRTLLFVESGFPPSRE